MRPYAGRACARAVIAFSWTEIAATVRDGVTRSAPEQREAS